jgi:GT2 family glycosyltransferase
MATGVTIVVPTFNRCESLLDTLSSIKELEIPDGVNCDVIIVDNDSSDDTPAVVQRAGRDSPINIRYLREIRKGSSYARNAGVYLASGELICFADDDVHVEKTWLGALLRAFQQHGAACVGGKVIPNWLGPRPRWLKDHFLNVLAMLDYGDRPQELGREGDNRMLYAANLAIRRSVFIEIGGFDTALGRRGLFGGGEDREIQERLIRRGYKVVYDPTAIVRHRVEPYRMRKRYFRRWHLAAGKDRAGFVRPARLHVFGIESYLIVEFVRTLARMFESACAMKFDEVFEHELKCILYLSIFGHKIRRAIKALC